MTARSRLPAFCGCGPRNLGRQWRAACGEEFDWVTPNAFRKTVATLIKEADIEAAASQLGHPDTRVTKKHYTVQTHRAPDLSGLLEKLAPASSSRNRG